MIDTLCLHAGGRAHNCDNPYDLSPLGLGADMDSSSRDAVPYYSPAIQARHSNEIDTRPPFPVQSTEFADIGYIFDEPKYLQRSEARLRSGGLPTDLPPGWPKSLDGPLVWTGSDFSNESIFTYYLTDEDQNEIRVALEHFKSLGKAGKHVNQASFPLPVLATKLERIQDDIYKGRGFAILRGLVVEDYPDDLDLVTVYLGLTSYVAERRGKQNHGGAVLSGSCLHAVKTPPCPCRYP